LKRAAAPKQRKGDGPAARLEALAWRARAALTWEKLWPPLSTAAAVALLFLAVSWAGLWLQAPRYIRIAGLVLFAAGLLAALFPLVFWRAPSRAAALRRLDRDSPVAHAPATAFEDDLANGSDDSETRALWSLHRARVAAEIDRLEVAAPSPGMAWRDPRALRYAALLLAVAAFLSAGAQRGARLASAFDFGTGAGAEAGDRVDAWIDPPAYTGRPPILMKIAGQSAPETIVAPEDSEIVLRAASTDYDGTATGAIKASPAPTKPQSIVERRFKVQGDGEFRVTRGGSRLATFVIRALAAGKPTIELIDPPKANASGSLALHYKIGDAYGVASAEAQFESPEAGKHRLVEPPRFGLSLPNAAGGMGEARTTGDLAEHPWAGAAVTMRLSATDVAGRVGESAPVQLTLPQRVFVNPLARALVEIRRKLILDPDTTRKRALIQLAALQLAPDQYATTPSVYLGLGAARARLERAPNDAALLEVAELLWAMALQIEDGDASQTLKDLRAMEQKLRDALKNGASEAEIRELTKQLRELAERYMREMAENAQPDDEADQQADAKDLDDMMNQLEENARNGSKESAQAMLDELQDMFENMRGARSAQQSEAAKQLRKQMGELDKLMRDQQSLRDKTFRRDQRQRGAHSDNQPQAGQEGDDQSADQQSLDGEQQALRERLKELERQLKSLGMKGEQGLDDAEGAMKDAEGDLKGEGQGEGQGDGQQPGVGQGRGGRTPLGDAVEAQGRALEALRKGAQGMQQQMQANGDGPGGYRARMRTPGQRNGGRDPLGRGQAGERGASEGLLHESPEGAARARQVQQELRRRLADPNRATEEKDYLERLLTP
jgi:uncharacterized protein (TIGR02302 family)